MPTKAELEQMLVASEREVAGLTRRLDNVRTSRDDARRRRNDLSTLLDVERGRASTMERDIARATADRDYFERRFRQRDEAVAKVRQELRTAKARLERATAPKKLTSVQEKLMSLAERVIPFPMRQTTKEIVTDDSMSDTLMALMDRERQLPSDEMMLLAGIGMNTQARRHFDRRLDAYWREQTPSWNVARSSYNRGMAEDIVIGSGPHAAIFAAVRYAKTGIKPIVIERSMHPGGAFAISSAPSFYLNSRNRPGPLSVPGDEFGALNVLPGAPLQPSDVAGYEYLTNADVAWVTRMALMMYADVKVGWNVDSVNAYNTNGNILGANGLSGSYVGRVYISTGLTAPRKAFAINDDRYLTFEEFMRRADMPFPLQGMRRVAVIGAGDGGKTVIESLTGQGPQSPLSVPSLDFVEKIDWYGVPEDRRTRETWESCNRSRYKGIGRLLPSEGPFRVQPLGNAAYLDLGYDCIKLDGMPYDYVVDCTGYGENPLFYRDNFDTFQSKSGQPVGLRNTSLYVMGPAANLEVARSDEQVLRGVAENTTSIFRYADRTARMAMEAGVA